MDKKSLLSNLERIKDGVYEVHRIKRKQAELWTEIQSLEQKPRSPYKDTVYWIEYYLKGLFYAACLVIPLFLVSCIAVFFSDTLSRSWDALYYLMDDLLTFFSYDSTGFFREVLAALILPPTLSILLIGLLMGTIKTFSQIYENANQVKLYNKQLNEYMKKQPEREEQILQLKNKIEAMDYEIDGIHYELRNYGVVSEDFWEIDILKSMIKGLELGYANNLEDSIVFYKREKYEQDKEIARMNHDEEMFKKYQDEQEMTRQNQKYLSDRAYEQQRQHSEKQVKANEKQLKATEKLKREVEKSRYDHW